MVKGCRRLLREGVTYYVQSGELKEIMPAGFWQRDFCSSHTKRLIACGDINLGDKVRGEALDDRLLCAQCAKREGFIW